MRSLNEFSLHESFLLLFYSWSQFYSSILVRQLFSSKFSLLLASFSFASFSTLSDIRDGGKWGLFPCFLTNSFHLYTTSLLLRFARDIFNLYMFPPQTHLYSFSSLHSPANNFDSLKQKQQFPVGSF